VLVAAKMRFSKSLDADRAVANKINAFEAGAARAAGGDIRWCFIEPDLVA